MAASRIFLSSLVLLAAGCTAPSPPQGPNLGVVHDRPDWDISNPPSGMGLPPGHGTARQGHAVYVQYCQSCHGENGQAGKADELVGGIGSLGTPDAERTVGSFWPYATTLFDYIRRAMPPGVQGTLSNDQLYAVTAWILAKNGIIGWDTEINAQTLSQVVMPNRNGFFTP